MSIKTLREVKDHVNVFTEEDHNDHVDNWNAQISINEELNPDDPDINLLIDQLKSIVSKMRKVKTGDWYYAQDHNLFVDAWNLQVQINDLLKEYIVIPVPPPPPTYPIMIKNQVELESWAEPQNLIDVMIISSVGR